MLLALSLFASIVGSYVAIALVFALFTITVASYSAIAIINGILLELVLLAMIVADHSAITIINTIILKLGAKIIASHCATVTTILQHLLLFRIVLILSVSIAAIDVANCNSFDVKRYYCC